MRSMVSRLAPWILMPIGVRMPVESMSMRALIGIVQALVQPGIWSVRLSSSISSSRVMPPPVRPRHAQPGPSHSGVFPDHQRRRSIVRQRSRGASFTTVSTIESGAGSVGVSERPALPNTDTTSGKARIIRSWTWR